MILVEDDIFNQFAPLFDQYGPNQPVIDATLAGFNPGSLWADKEDPNQNCLLVTRYGFAFGWGTKLEGALRSHAKEANKSLTFIPKRSSSEKFGVPIQRLDFFGPNDVSALEKATHIPHLGLEFVPIKANNFTHSNWESELIETFGNAIMFEKSGGGVALTDGKDLIAEALIGFVGKKYVEIGTVTHPDHRGKGYSTIVCGELIKQINARGLIPYWSCDSENLGSVRVAEKLGFKSSRPYIVYRVEP